jgi:hypothetical protein
MASRLTLLRWCGYIGILTAVLSVSAGTLAAQSLGQVARDAEAKRKSVKSGKVYTNDSLRSDSTPAQPAPAATTPPAATPQQPEGTPDPAKTDPAKDEAAWKQRIKAERDALAKANAFADALQSQINGLYAEFTACQSGPQCADVSKRRQKAIADLDSARKEIEQHTKAIADIQEEARKAGVPAGWVR